MIPKRIIMMYISEVSGHHSATIAIEKSVKALSPKAEVLNLNAFNYTNPISEKVVNSIYMSVIKITPNLWKYLYDNPKIAKQVASIKEKIHKVNSPKLKDLFDKFRPDAVVCTQAFPCGMVADYKSTYGSSLPLVAVLTDFVPHSYWIYDKVDYYVAPSEEVALRLVKKGVPHSKIKVLGIPFDANFNRPVSREEVIRKLKLDPLLKNVLIMGGGQGLGPIKTIIKTLDKARTPLQEVVVCGTNKKLYSSLKKKASKYKKNVRAFGYINNVNELMSAADIIISKPGGVTTAEALSKALPMVILKPIPGQEESNSDYLTDKGSALRIDDPKKIDVLIDSLFSDDRRLNLLKEAANIIAKPEASNDIAKLILSL